MGTTSQISRCCRLYGLAAIGYAIGFLNPFTNEPIGADTENEVVFSLTAAHDAGPPVSCRDVVRSARFSMRWTMGA